MVDPTICSTSEVLRGWVVSLTSDGEITVSAVDGKHFKCVRLYASGSELTLEVGDEVLVYTAEEDKPGIVLGRVGSSKAASAVKESSIVLEARESLTLKCGDGSITIRQDGKILIKGKDLVSHALRMNRIKGSSVSIN